MKTNEIFNIGKDFLKVESNRKSIYKQELFNECPTDKQKKALRIKLRRKRDNFISMYLSSKKDKNKLNQIFNLWKQYSEKVYNDVNIIIDNNSTQENIKICNEFINNFKKYLEESKKVKKPKEILKEPEIKTV